MSYITAGRGVTMKLAVLFLYRIRDSAPKDYISSKWFICFIPYARHVLKAPPCVIKEEVTNVHVMKGSEI